MTKRVGLPSISSENDLILKIKSLAKYHLHPSNLLYLLVLQIDLHRLCDDLQFFSGRNQNCIKEFHGAKLDFGVRRVS